MPPVWPPPVRADLILGARCATAPGSPRLGGRGWPGPNRSADREETPVSKKDEDTLYVIGAAYDSVEDAVGDYESVKQLYDQVKASHDFDAAVISKDADGEVHIV